MSKGEVEPCNKLLQQTEKGEDRSSSNRTPASIDMEQGAKISKAKIQQILEEHIKLKELRDQEFAARVAPDIKKLIQSYPFFKHNEGTKKETMEESDTSNSLVVRTCPQKVSCNRQRLCDDLTNHPPELNFKKDLEEEYKPTHQIAVEGVNTKD